MKLKLLSALLLSLLVPETSWALSDSQIPTKIQTYWASSAPVGNVTCPIPIPSQIAITNGRASWTDGFPPLTFNPVAAGGVPPFGQDFNGVLCQLSQWTRWYTAGAPVVYDNSFQSAIGGYPNGAIVGSAAVAGAFYISTVDNNTSDPDTGGANWTPWPLALFGGTSGGSANVQTVTIPGINSLAGLKGMTFSFIPGAANTGSFTVNVNGYGAVAAYIPNINYAGVPQGGELGTTTAALFTYDGTKFELINPIPNPVYSNFYVCKAADAFYCSGAGTDSGNCSQASRPCLTISYATLQVLRSNANGTDSQIIHIGTGTWIESVNVNFTPPGAANVNGAYVLYYSGNGATHTFWAGDNVQCGTLISNQGASVGVENMFMESNVGPSCQNTLYAENGGQIYVFGGIIFGATQSDHLHCEDGGSLITAASGFTLNGDMGGGLVGSTNQCIVAIGGVVDILNNSTATIFLFAELQSQIYLASPSWVGALGSGTRYNVSTLSIIVTGGAGCSSIPGTGGTVDATTFGVCQ